MTNSLRTGKWPIEMVDLSKIVIFHSHVSLPEDTIKLAILVGRIWNNRGAPLDLLGVRGITLLSDKANVIFYQ